MQDVIAQQDLVDELRAMTQRLETLEKLNAVIQTQLDLKADALAKTTAERDYYRNVASDLCARGQLIRDAADDMVEAAVRNAKALMISPVDLQVAADRSKGGAEKPKPEGEATDTTPGGIAWQNDVATETRR